MVSVCRVYHHYDRLSNYVLPGFVLSYPGHIARDDAKAVGDLAEAKSALFAQPPDLPHVALGQLGVAVPLFDIDAQGVLGLREF